MKARNAIVIGLAILAAACSSATPTVTPPSSTQTTVSPVASTSTTSVNPNNSPPPVPHCYYTGSGYGTCEGIILPMRAQSSCSRTRTRRESSS